MIDANEYDDGEWSWLTETVSEDGLAPDEPMLAPCSETIDLTDVSLDSEEFQVTDAICDHNPLPDDWPNGLCHFKGSRVRLCGIDVYYDFTWEGRFPHKRKTFPDGQTLAAFVLSKCPEDKTATLLLTIRTNIKPGVRITDTRYIAIVHIDSYLKHKNSPATTYFFSNISTSLETLQELENNQQALKHFINRHIDDSIIEDWIETDPARLDSIQHIIDSRRSETENSRAGFSSVLKRWSQIDIPADDITALVKSITDNSKLASLVSALADKSSELTSLSELEFEDGRRMVAAALRASERADVLRRLKQLLHENGSVTQLKELIYRNWWILERYYIKSITCHNHLPQNEDSLLLQTADGYCDLIKVYRPDSPLFDMTNGKICVSNEVNAAVNQAAHYISDIEKGQRDTEAMYSPSPLFKLQAVVIIGTIDDAHPNHKAKRDSVRMYNSHLNRIRVVTYDELLRIGEQIVHANTGEVQYAASLKPQHTHTLLGATDGN